MGQKYILAIKIKFSLHKFIEFKIKNNCITITLMLIDIYYSLF